MVIIFFFYNVCCNVMSFLLFRRGYNLHAFLCNVQCDLVSNISKPFISKLFYLGADSMEISDEAVLVDCSRLKSAVWKDFDVLKRGDVCIDVCKYCKKKLSGSRTRNWFH